MVRFTTRAPIAAGIPTVRAMAVVDLPFSTFPNSSSVAWCFSVGCPSRYSTSTSWWSSTMSWIYRSCVSAMVIRRRLLIQFNPFCEHEIKTVWKWWYTRVKKFGYTLIIKLAIYCKSPRNQKCIFVSEFCPCQIYTTEVIKATTNNKLVRASPTIMHLKLCILGKLQTPKWKWQG